MIKRLFLTLLLIISATSAFAVEYRSVGSNAEFCVYTFDGQYFLILSFKDDEDNRLSNNTVIKFKLKDGSIIRLEGYNGSTKTSMDSVHWGFGISSGSTSEKHFAIVAISPEQIDKLKIGVDRIAINTVPEAYKRHTWTGKSKFGQLLYEDFINLKDEFDEVISKDITVGQE